MSSVSDSIPAVKPIYFLEKNAPDNLSVADICEAAEKVAGSGSVFGCTLIYAVWRLKPLQMVARAKLLANGIVIKGKRIALESVNPNYNKNGGETVGTRLTVSNLPFSYSNDAILRNLTQLGVKARSAVKMEKARGRDQKMTDWANGRRVVWIDLPDKPLPKSVRMGDFRANLYYREMKSGTNTKCYNCLQEGHRAVDCPSEVVCHTCKKTGHKRGDALCTLGFNHGMTEEVDSIWGSDLRVGNNQIIPNSPWGRVSADRIGLRENQEVSFESEITTNNFEGLGENNVTTDLGLNEELIIQPNREIENTENTTSYDDDGGDKGACSGGEAVGGGDTTQYEPLNVGNDTLEDGEWASDESVDESHDENENNITHCVEENVDNGKLDTELSENNLESQDGIHGNATMENISENTDVPSISKNKKK